MVNKIHQTLKDYAWARWSVLALVAFTMLCGYFISDVMAPLDTLLTEMGWTSSDYGWFTSAYGWFNVFAFMLIIGGIMLDKFGVRITGIISCLLMAAGAYLKYFAVSPSFSMTGEIFGHNIQVAVAALGFAIFGVGVEIAGITVTKIIAKWFKGYEIALAMGLQVAVARIGTSLALGASLPLARAYHISTPILVALTLLCVGTIAYIGYCAMDKRLDNEEAKIEEAKNQKKADQKEDNFSIKDLGKIVTNKGFWLIAILCVLFYSAVFPFLKYATGLMINKYGVEPELAGTIPSLLPFGTIFLTPFFGNIYDRKGKGATIMMIGSFMLIIVHLLFALPILNYWWFATLVMILLGVTFSLVPSAMWPSVPKIIPEKQLGSAYALICWVQNWGLMGVPDVIGKSLESPLAKKEGSDVVDYTVPLLVFVLFGVLALGVSYILKKVDAKEGYGLEKPNITTEEINIPDSVAAQAN